MYQICSNLQPRVSLERLSLASLRKYFSTLEGISCSSKNLKSVEKADKDKEHTRNDNIELGNENKKVAKGWISMYDVFIQTHECDEINIVNEEIESTRKYVFDETVNFNNTDSIIKIEESDDEVIDVCSIDPYYNCERSCLEPEPDDTLGVYKENDVFEEKWETNGYKFEIEASINKIENTVKTDVTELRSSKYEKTNMGDILKSYDSAFDLETSDFENSYSRADKHKIEVEFHSKKMGTERTTRMKHVRQVRRKLLIPKPNGKGISLFKNKMVMREKNGVQNPVDHPYILRRRKKKSNSRSINYKKCSIRERRILKRLILEEHNYSLHIQKMGGYKHVFKEPKVQKQLKNNMTEQQSVDLERRAKLKILKEYCAATNPRLIVNGIVINTHNIAERNRRSILRELFTKLSSLVMPDVEKPAKINILHEAQQEIKSLEAEIYDKTEELKYLSLKQLKLREYKKRLEKMLEKKS